MSIAFHPIVDFVPEAARACRARRRHARGGLPAGSPGLPRTQNAALQTLTISQIQSHLSLERLFSGSGFFEHVKSFTSLAAAPELHLTRLH